MPVKPRDLLKPGFSIVEGVVEGRHSLQKETMVTSASVGLGDVDCLGRRVGLPVHKRPTAGRRGKGVCISMSEN